LAGAIFLVVKTALKAMSHPVKISANQFLLFFVLLSVVLYFGRELLVPIVFSAFFAMLLAPICRWLEGKGVGRVPATIICVFILLVALLGIFAIVVGELTSFIDDLPTIQKKMLSMIDSMESYFERSFNMSRSRQSKIVEQQISNLGKSTGNYFGAVINSITSMLGGLVLVVVYTFLLLFHKEKYETFFFKIYADHDPERVTKILEEVTAIGQKYLTGRAISVLALWIIYAIALLLFGLKNSILLAAIAALLSIIPYIGSILGSIFPFLVAIVMKDISTALWVTIVLLFLHALSTYFIEPMVIGRKVKLSALSMLVSILAGGFIWGVAGMILFIPILAMAKIVFEHVSYLQPYALLVGDPDEGNETMLEAWFMNLFKRQKKRKR
jgi:predicted PurR-regulated permease PerM